MSSITNLIEVIDQLKAEAADHSLTPEHLESLNEIAEMLRGIKTRDIAKDATEISLNIATVIKLIIEWLGDSS